MIVPAFPLLGEPGEFDELTLLSATVFLEAEGEPAPGPEAVAHVVMNRHRGWKLSVPQVILGKDGRAYDDGRAFEVFSCWNDDYRRRAEARLGAARDEAVFAWKAAAGALWTLTADPTLGADHYLNVELTRKIRPDHGLPSWYDPAKVTVVLGRHTFLRLT